MLIGRRIKGTEGNQQPSPILYLLYNILFSMRLRIPLLILFPRQRFQVGLRLYLPALVVATSTRFRPDSLAL